MRAIEKDGHVQTKLYSHGVAVDLEQARILRRAELTLHRWAERECGFEQGASSACITRDEKTGKPFIEVSPHMGGPNRLYPIADLERGALKRIAKVCAEVGAHYYHQGDCRGVMLYVSRKPLTDTNYSNGCAVRS